MAAKRSQSKRATERRVQQARNLASDMGRQNRRLTADVERSMQRRTWTYWREKLRARLALRLLAAFLLAIVCLLFDFLIAWNRLDRFTLALGLELVLALLVLWVLQWRAASRADACGTDGGERHVE